jgi:UDP:flavonoid glycosyltransferase YjiC (YdhE family)
MKLLVVSTPATGHLNPMIAITKMLMEDGHDVAFLTGSFFRDRIEKVGARFDAFYGKADVDFRDPLSAVPELRGVEPGLDWMRIAINGFFVDRVADQHQSVQNVLNDFPADAIIADDMFFGLVPMLMGPTTNRPPVLMCGTSVLHWRREDKAPLFLGLLPAETAAQLKDYEVIAEEYEARVNQPSLLRLNGVLKDLGVGPLRMPLFESVVLLADSYLQLSVPGFEFARAVPPSVSFAGALPIIRGQAPLPPWASDLEGPRKVVLVTQGTFANHDLGLLIGPTLAALADEPDILVVATAGGRPVDAIPGPIPVNARVSDYLPFEWLLPNVDLMVTNGGYGSVNQALSFGIPIIGAGLTEDKADVNARIAWSGAGIDLKSNNPTSDAIRAAVRTALDTPDYRRNAQRLAAEFSSYDAKEAILSLLQQHHHARRPQAA